MEKKYELPIIDFSECTFGNFAYIKEPWQMILKILDTQNHELFDKDIEIFIQENNSIKAWKKQVPMKLSKNMNTYQEYNTGYDKDEFEKEINDTGLIIPTGQYLFHGGFLNMGKGESKIFDRPFATSLSPGEALFHAIHAGKAYDKERIELFVLLTHNIKTNAIILFQDGMLLCNELEVLFASGLNLIVDNILTNVTKFRVKNVDDTKEKEVPIDIIMCRIY